MLLKLHISIKQRDLDIALLHSVKAGYPECTRVLLEAGACPDARDSYDNTPLILACETGSHHTVKMLLDAGASVELHGGGRGTALHKAANWGYEDCIELLLDHSADPNAQDGLWRTPIMLAAMHAPHAHAIMHRLINAKCDVNTPGTESKTVLHYAALRGLDPTTLLVAGADANALDSGRHTALLLAAMAGHGTVVKTLIQAGCDPRAVNYQHRSALHLAAIKGDIACLELLMEAAALEADSVDLSGNRPIWYAAYNGHYDAIVFFIRCNCRLEGDSATSACHSSGNLSHPVSNPLIAALDKRHMDIARVLLVAGCGSRALTDWLLTLPQTTWSEENAEHLEWMTNFVQNPRELGHLCRLVVREVLRGTTSNTATAIEALPLPKKLQQYLFMNELLVTAAN